ncbi:MAG: hypothetical protein KAG66_23545, partial [Methylococcales bacterium]|nr:hypothetical protein [Methylococcales bacterium]
MTFPEYLQKKGYSKTYLADNLRIMRQYIAWTQKEQMTDAEHSRTVDVMAWEKELRSTTEPATASKYMVSIKHWFDWLVDQGTILSNPAHIIHIRPDKKKKL